MRYKRKHTKTTTRFIKSLTVNVIRLIKIHIVMTKFYIKVINKQNFSYCINLFLKN